MQKEVRGKPKNIRIVTVVEIETEIEDESVLMPKRAIKEFWTLDNKYIGRIDLLDDYLELEEAIISSASSETNSKDIK